MEEFYYFIDDISRALASYKRRIANKKRNKVELWLSYGNDRFGRKRVIYLGTYNGPSISEAVKEFNSENKNNDMIDSIVAVKNSKGHTEYIQKWYRVFDNECSARRHGYING